MSLTRRWRRHTRANSGGGRAVSEAADKDEDEEQEDEDEKEQDKEGCAVSGPVCEEAAALSAGLGDDVDVAVAVVAAAVWSVAANASARVAVSFCSPAARPASIAASRPPHPPSHHSPLNAPRSRGRACGWKAAGRSAGSAEEQLRIGCCRQTTPAGRTRTWQTQAEREVVRAGRCQTGRTKRTELNAQGGVAEEKIREANGCGMET